MFIFYGRKIARIKTYTDHQNACPHCKAFDLDIEVYREYFHLYWIPAFPAGVERSIIECNACGNRVTSNPISQEYEQKARAPIYFYIWPILFAILIGFMIYSSIETQNEKAGLVADPKVGDIYTIRKKEDKKTTYYFLRLISVEGDTVRAYHNNFVYSGEVNRFQDGDFFDESEELMLLKPQLKNMMDDGEINSVNRGYGDADSFNRMK